MNERIEWMNERMNEWINVCMYVCIFIPASVSIGSRLITI